MIGNFHYHPLEETIGPLVLMLNPEISDNLLVRFNPEHIASVIPFIERTWRAIIPHHPFEYRFLDEELEKSLFSLGRTQSLLSVFAALAIIISCLGLLGLSSHAVEQRTKEIGIRKTLGASVSGLAFLFSKEFARWILLANLAAWPLAYFILNRWLQNFAYRIDLNIWTFLASGLTALAISLVTVGSRSIRASRANPVESLHHE